MSDRPSEGEGRLRLPSKFRFLASLLFVGVYKKPLQFSSLVFYENPSDLEDEKNPSGFFVIISSLEFSDTASPYFLKLPQHFRIAMNIFQSTLLFTI
jgi:hypothetical protein